MVYEDGGTPCILDLSLPKTKKQAQDVFKTEDSSNRYRPYPIHRPRQEDIKPLHLTRLDSTSPFKMDMEVGTPPLTPTTPTCTSFKKHILRRYSKFAFPDFLTDFETLHTGIFMKLIYIS